MLFFAENHLYLPGLGPKVFVLPVLVMMLLIVTLGIFFRRSPQSAPYKELEDRDEDSVEEKNAFLTAHYDRVVPAIIAAGFYLLALWQLGYPPKQVFDEVHHVRTAMDFVWGYDPHEWTHPHLSKLLQAGSLSLAHEYFDPSEKVWSQEEVFSPRAAVAWRLPSVIFGTLALLGQYALARALFKNRLLATLSMLLLAIDGVFFVQSRIAMTNIFTVCFIIWATWAAWRWTEEQRIRHLFAMGIFSGLAIATRWSSLYAFALLVIFVLGHAVLQWKNAKWSVPFFFRRAVSFLFFLIAIPTLIYAASYIPYILQGNGTAAQKLLSWDYNGHGWGKVVSMQGDMYQYHSTLNAEHDYASPAWSWPFMLRPVWYYYEAYGQPGQEMVRDIWCIGNAFIWWAMIPVMLFGTILAVRYRRSHLGLLCLLGLGQWFCWLAKARGLNFMHYLFEAIPFVSIALAYFLVTLWEFEAEKKPVENQYLDGDTPVNTNETWRIIVASYVMATLFWFLFYYPVLTATPIPSQYSQMHYWLGRIWI